MSHPQPVSDFSSTPTSSQPMKAGFKTGRRQHRSCDQCRKGKRACDVAFAKEPGGNADDIAALGPCSNCKRTGKNCTLQWLRAVHRASLRPRRDLDTPGQDPKPDDATTTALSQQPSPSTRARTQPAASDQQPPAYAYSYPYSPDVDDPVLASLLPPQPPLAAHQHQHAHPPPALPDQWPSSGFDPLPLRAVADALDDDFRFEEVPRPDLHHHQPHQQQQHHQQHDHQHPPQPDYQHAFFPPAPASNVSPGSNGLYLAGAAWECDETSASPESAVEDVLTDAVAQQQQSELVAWRATPGFGHERRGRRSGSAGSFSSFVDNLQPSTLQSRLASSMNQSELTKGLWKVYHDSFENALSCWLTEKTCPYTYQMLPAQGDDGGAALSEVWGPACWADPASAYMAALFGGTDHDPSSQGNRIVKRVCHLDRAWARLRRRGPPGAHDDRAASRALQLAIMAFATQWAQGSQRSAAHFAQDGAMPCPLDGEFDRMLQEQFWHQARRALQDAADCDSFRVVLAHIIFSFTQKPLNLDQLPAPADAADTSRLDDIIEAEGPPVFLETATRQVFAHRAKLNRMAGPASHLETADRKRAKQTFDMMFWLCVMFDTLSAVMNDRPLIVSDKDSKIHPDRTAAAAKPRSNSSNSTSTATTMFDAAAPGPGLSSSSTGDLFTDGAFAAALPEEPQGGGDLWGDLFLQPKQVRWSSGGGGAAGSGGIGVGMPRWPCSYEEAATTLCNASPVKVLLYRKVARLQTLMSRASTPPAKMEAAVGEALKVYAHWNATYRQFFLDCMAHHEALPPRIQSWYVILAGHWHLAALSLADMVARVDDEGDEGMMGLPAQRERRLQSRLVARLRRDNAAAMADVGRVSSPGGADSSFARAHDFHFAVNKGALLTEPWTVVLVRAFAKSARVLLDLVPVPDNNNCAPPINVGAANECLRRAEHCIKALWYLGRKSDMAYLVATILSNNLKAKALKLAAPPRQNGGGGGGGGAAGAPAPTAAAQQQQHHQHQPQQHPPQPRRPTMDSNFYDPWQGWGNGGHMDTSLYASL
ncbi:hypothetical protein SLS58_009004 [Diplodia intermedia]|uniref:Zn(2)-C6 fungal-type domain-containing protein n=1 Tax=Diplodia intermedia TaxID=856260 RepID=A0ABR3TEW2_9PEZI